MTDIKFVWKIGYIVSISGLFITLLTRGIVQGFDNAPSSALNSALSGIAGLTHIALAIFVILIKLSSTSKSTH